MREVWAELVNSYNEGISLFLSGKAQLHKY